MHTKLSHILFAGLLCLLAACDATSQDEGQAPRLNPNVSPELARLVQSDNAFGIDLFTNMSAEAPDENVFLSPLSISMALGMVRNGAQGNTLNEMNETLGKDALDEAGINASYRSILDIHAQLDPAVAVNLANSIWYRDNLTVLPNFLDTNKAVFDAEIAALDFNAPEALSSINSWVDDKTNGKIEKIIDAISPQDVMYLINAIYFKGTWTYQFDENETKEAPFYGANRTTLDVPLMHLYNRVPFASNDDVSLIDLPYGDSLYSMTLVLPKTDGTLDAIIADMDENSWDNWTRNMQPAELDIFVPRFKMTYEQPLNEILKSMGMLDAFDESRADFAGINPDLQLYISKVMHKALIEVNEEGTEAAAVTSVSVGVTSVGEDPVPTVFRADKPFLFAIREHHTGAILFIGKVLNL